MDDLISRQAAINAIKHNQDIYSNNFGGDAIDKYTVAIIANDIETLINLPSAVRLGRWIDKYNDGDWHCSECGAIVEKDEQNRHNWYRCYHCGAKMEGEQNG